MTDLDTYLRPACRRVRQSPTRHIEQFDREELFGIDDAALEVMLWIPDMATGKSSSCLINHRVTRHPTLSRIDAAYRRDVFAVDIDPLSDLAQVNVILDPRYRGGCCPRPPVVFVDAHGREMIGHLVKRGWRADPVVLPGGRAATSASTLRVEALDDLAVEGWANVRSPEIGMRTAVALRGAFADGRLFVLWGAGPAEPLGWKEMSGFTLAGIHSRQWVLTNDGVVSLVTADGFLRSFSFSAGPKPSAIRWIRSLALTEAAVAL